MGAIGPSQEGKDSPNERADKTGRGEDTGRNKVQLLRSSGCLEPHENVCVKGGL